MKYNKGHRINKSIIPGTRFINNQGYNLIVLEYFSAANITVQFDDGTIVKNRQLNDARIGNIKNPNSPKVFGIGFFGQGDYSQKCNEKIYNKWKGILERCYSAKHHERYPSYKDCSVDPIWHNFQVFAKWFEENYVDDWQLDKDILVSGNKVYGPDTCCFVPREINNLFIKPSKPKKYPIGIGKKGDKFVACCCLDKKQTIIGTFKTIEEAFLAYKITKEKEIKRVADKFKNQITDRVYESMYSYEVRETD